MKRVLLISLVLVVAILFVARFQADRKFVVEPQPIPEQQVQVGTALYSAVENNLATQQGNEDEQSLFVPLGASEVAFISRMLLADAAEATLDLQYYLFHDDEAGRALLAMITEVADRGVAVRLLIDDMDTSGREGNLARLAQEHPNLQIRVFNPVYTRSLRFIDFIARFPRSSRRMHNKSMTADRIASIVGGRNVGNEYFNIATDHAFTDYDVLTAGTLPGLVSTEFESYWFSGLAVDISELGTPASGKSYDDWLALLKNALSHYRSEMKKIADNVVTDLLDGRLKPYYSTGKLINDPPTKVLNGFSDNKDWLAHQIIEVMNTATSELLIVSPYFIPGDALVERFGKMVAAGVKVSVLTNALAANDVLAVHAAYMGYRKQLLEVGVNLYEMKAQTEDIARKFTLVGSKRSSLHAKTFIVDKSRSFVGSFNLDARSAVQNTEMGVVFENAQYGSKAANAAIAGINNIAYRVELSETGDLQWTFVEGGESTTVYKEPDTSVFVRIFSKIVAILPVEWLL